MSRLPEVFVYDAATENGRMSFGRALQALKAGLRVQRAGWNGKGMWLALTPGSVLNRGDSVEVRHPDHGLRGAASVLALTEDPEQIRIGGHIDMRAADGSLVIGWLASQTDMLAEDWSVLP